MRLFTLFVLIITTFLFVSCGSDPLNIKDHSAILEVENNTQYWIGIYLGKEGEDLQRIRWGDINNLCIHQSPLTLNN